VLGRLTKKCIGKNTVPGGLILERGVFRSSTQRKLLETQAFYYITAVRKKATEKIQSERL
jgi:hypothetical protein